jgi:hypothetical protein
MNNKKMLGALSKLNSLRVDIGSVVGRIFRRNIFFVILTTIGMSTINTVAANAATTIAPKTDINIHPFFGCADVTWLMPLAPLTSNISGKFVTLLIIAAVVFFMIQGAKLLLAGSRIDRTQDALAGIKNIVIGILVLSIGVAILLAAIPLFFGAICTS